MVGRIFVTTGATKTFKELIEFSVSLELLDYLNKSLVSELIIQYGLDRSVLTDGVSKLDVNLQLDNRGKGKFEFKNLLVTLFEFHSDICSVIEGVDWVISHAGTGSILDALRLSKPTLVIVNNNLMDNHQLQISQAFEEQNLLIYDQFEKKPYNYRQVLKKVDSIVSYKITFSKLEAPRKNILNTIISQELYLGP